MSSFTDLTATNLKSGFNPNPMPTPTNTPFQWPFPNVTEPVGVMEFNGHASFAPEHHIYSNEYLPNFTNFHKRRSTSPPLPILPPAKQLITEEKIAAHFNSMSLSNDNSQLFAYNEIDDMDDGPSTSSGHFASAAELEEKLKRAQRIIVCEKVRSQLKEANSEPIIPKVLLDMERSKCPSTSGGCKALILWEPPANKSPLSSFITRKTEEENEDAEELDNNNSSNFENNNNANMVNNNNNIMEDVAMDDL